MDMDPRNREAVSVFLVLLATFAQSATPRLKPGA